MSGLAEILLEENFRISGSDAKSSPLTRTLEERGAVIYYGQRASNIKDDVDVVVYTAAIHPDNPEFACAKEKGLPMLTRAELLGQIMRNYDTPIAISGTHGKTTTTSMVSHILLEGDCDPTISVGGILPAIHGNIRVGNSETFITEACEYTNSFLSFFPKISVILNMDADHLDFFKDIDDIRHSFRKFAELLPADGTLIINADTPKYETITRELPCNVLTYGLEHDADYTAADITWDKYGHPSFSVLFQGKKIGSYYLRVPGIHNVSNALAAIAVGRLLELPDDVIVKGLGSFTGTDRRFQYKGEIGGAPANLVNRDFHATAPNRLWVTDITEFSIPAGKVYLSPVIDCHDGMPVAWTIGTSPNAALANGMLRDACATLKPGETPIIHSDRGCHYRWPEWIRICTEHGLTRSMSAKGCSPDNAAAEGFFGRLKQEFFHKRSFRGVTIDEFTAMLDEYMVWYRDKRIKTEYGMSIMDKRIQLGLVA